MNKVGSIGIAIVIVAVIIGVAYSISSQDTNNDSLPTVEEEIITEESERTGTDYSVELTEKMGLKSP